MFLLCTFPPLILCSLSTPSTLYVRGDLNSVGPPSDKTFPAINFHVDFSPVDLDMEGRGRRGDFSVGIIQRGMDSMRSIKTESSHLRRVGVVAMGRLFKLFSGGSSLLQEFAQTTDTTTATATNSSTGNATMLPPPPIILEKQDFPQINIALAATPTFNTTLTPLQENSRFHQIQAQHSKDRGWVLALLHQQLEELKILKGVVLGRMMSSAFIETGEGAGAGDEGGPRGVNSDGGRGGVLQAAGNSSESSFLESSAGVGGPPGVG